MGSSCSLNSLSCKSCIGHDMCYIEKELIKKELKEKEAQDERNNIEFYKN